MLLPWLREAEKDFCAWGRVLGGRRCLGVLPSHKPHASRFFIREASDSKSLCCCMDSLQILSQLSGKGWGEKYLR